MPRIKIVPEEKTERGALDGFRVTCSCGWTVKTPWEGESHQFAISHADWHVKQNAKKAKAKK